MRTKTSNKKNILVYGAGEAGKQLVASLEKKRTNTREHLESPIRLHFLGGGGGSEHGRFHERASE